MAHPSETRVLTIYKASAGSGKTYALTYEYLRDLLTVKNPETGEYRLNHPAFSPKGSNVNRHRHILAITFTNKATEEMKKRIISRLHDLTVMPASDAKDADYANDLMALTGCTREQLAMTAAAALEQLLFDFHNFNVSTIDSFFQRVLRNFARELDRQGDFEIELSESVVMNSAVDDMLDDFNISLAGTTPLETWLERFMKDEIDRGEKGDLLNRNSRSHREMVSLISKITSEKFTPYEQAMKDYLSDSGMRLTALQVAIDRRIKEIKEEIAGMATSIITELSGYKDNGGIVSFALNFVKKLANHEDLDIKKELIPYNTGEKKIFKKTHTCPDDVKARIEDEISRAAGLRIHLDELALIKSALYTLSFLSFAWDYLHKFYTENNVVLLANTNNLIHRIIDGSDVPFIYERLGTRLHNFLIDEFQDTSKMQWSNLKPLVANSIAETHDNLIIGDVKQSIYRFRNSEPDLLHRQVQEDDFPLYSTVRGDKTAENTNYRSSATVITFNNTLFRRLATKMKIGGYEHVVQAVPAKHADFRGYVRFLPISKLQKGGAKKNESEDENLSERERIEKKCQQLPLLAEQIRRQHLRGGYRFKDIAILCDKRDECAKVIEYLLQYHSDIPVLSSDSLLLESSPAVKLIIAMLRLLSNVQAGRSTGRGGKDYASLADMNLAVSRFEYFISQPESNGDPEVALGRALDSAESVESVVGEILASHPSSLQALIDSIISQRIPPQMRHDQLPYLLALQDYVAQYSERGTQSVNSFLRWWDENSSSFTIPFGSDIDAVTVLTVHKSKGLEFPCVHLPFASREVVSKKYKNAYIWIPMPRLEGIDPSLLPPAILTKVNKVGDWEKGLFYDTFKAYLRTGEIDTVNLTYVAFTRAEAELIVYYDPKEDMGKDLSECLGQEATAEERSLDFTLDLARYFDSETGEFILGEETFEKNLPRNKDNASKDAHNESADVAESANGTEGADVAEGIDVAESADKVEKVQPEPYSPEYHVYPRPDTQIITSVESLLDEKADIEDESPSPTRRERRGFDSPEIVYGNMMHDILSNTRLISDLDSAVALVAASKQYDAEEVKKGGETLRGVLNMNREELARWFRDFDTVLCEQSIYIPNIPKPNYRRPDRLVFRPDGRVEVVDFKFTASEEPEHKTQVREYVSLLREMGFDLAGGWLWYPLLPGSPTVKC